MKELSSISKYYDPEYTLGPFGIGTIKHKNDGIKHCTREKEIGIKCKNLCTNKSGKVKPGKDLAAKPAVKFNSSMVRKTIQLKSDPKKCFIFFKEKYDTCSSLFSSQFRKAESIKRKRSRTRERHKKSKLDRYLANKERILKLIRYP